MKIDRMTLNRMRRARRAARRAGTNWIEDLRQDYYRAEDALFKVIGVSIVGAVLVLSSPVNLVPGTSVSYKVALYLLIVPPLFALMAGAFAFLDSSQMSVAKPAELANQASRRRRLSVYYLVTMALGLGLLAKGHLA